MFSGNNRVLFVVNLMFFQVGLLMSVMSVIIPEVINTFEVSYGMASVLPFSFYIALASFSVPAGIAGAHFSAKRILLVTFAFALCGVLTFVAFLSFWSSALSVFIMGSAVAVIQVTAAPLVRRACGPERFAFHSTLNQLMYGLGAFLSPVIYSALIDFAKSAEGSEGLLRRTMAAVVPGGFEWVSAYWLFAAIIAVFIGLLSWVKFPEHRVSKDTITQGESYFGLLRRRHVIIFFLALLAYASCEQGIAAWLTKFFEDHHGVDPQREGAMILSYYWLLLTAGCSVGLVLLKFFPSRLVLMMLTVLAIVFFLIGLLSSARVAMWAFPLVAACESVMWPVILSLALNSVKQDHEKLSGLMYTASLGGAIGPVVVGFFGDQFGLQWSLGLLLVPFLFVLIVSIWARGVTETKDQEAVAV